MFRSRFRPCLLGFAAVLTGSLGFFPSSSWTQEVFQQTPRIAASEVREAITAAVPESPQPPAVDLQAGPKPKWIWGPVDGRARYNFHRTFSGKGVAAAAIIATCDNSMTVKLNGKTILSGSEWNDPLTRDITKLVQEGENQLLVEAGNEGSVAGLAVKLGLKSSDGKVSYLVSDDSWKAAEPEQPRQMLAVKLHGAMGVSPWGDVFAGGGNRGGGALPRLAPNVFRTLPGFQVELLYTVPKDKLGSWVCMAFDDKGRILASDQGGKGIVRITPSPIGSDEPTKVEPLDIKITSAQGMLHAFGALYFSVNGGPGSGFYRARDTNGDDQYDELKLLKRFAGGGEHGPHALRLSPDGTHIYVIAGNHTNPPEGLTGSRIRQNWSEDHLLPRQWDARGHARGKLAPGGWICRTDPEGATWEMFSIGYRNPYDMDFNADGELFAYDADMEWDMGTPWYRPTRVVHATSGSEFGWRSGTGKWPTYYADSLPPAVNIGPGSPVGATFGYGAKFPAKYQRALFVLDWTFGTMYAIHLQADGASYMAEKEEFLSRTPLPLTDAAVGPDGALYFTVGGRGTQSELFRVTYVGDATTAPVDAQDSKFAAARERRHALERLHVDPDPKQLNMIWESLGDADRHIRFAARTALEHLPAQLWQQRVVAETNPQQLVEATIALARQGDPQLQGAALETLGDLDPAELSKRLRLDLIRAYSLLFIRHGKPDAKTLNRVAAEFDPLYPAATDDENRELSRLLVYCNSPTVIEKTLKLMASPRKQSRQEVSELLARNRGYGGTIAKMLANLPELQNIHYAFVLRNVRYGWTLEQRREYFQWLNEAKQRSGGASYVGFIENIRKEALANASEAERKALERTSPPPKPKSLPKPQGPGRDYSVEDLEKLVQAGLRGRSFDNGKRAFAATRCVVCHRYDGNGGATGPDLTNVAARFQARDLAEAIVDPSKVISDQYRAHQLRTSDGEVITGRLVSEADGQITMLTDPEDATKVKTIPKDEIEVMRPSPTSLMPKDLVKPLNQEELADLLAYLLSRGDPNHPMFQK